MRSSFFTSVEVIEFHTTDAYSNLGLTSEKYKVNKLSRVENEKLILDDDDDNNNNIIIIIIQEFRKLFDVTEPISRILSDLTSTGCKSCFCCHNDCGCIKP
jgi:hypothetical protein